MKKQSLLLACCCLLVMACAAQAHKYKRNYYSGYILTNYGDTLIGRVKSDQNFTRKVRFIADNDTLQKTVSIPLADIKLMRLNLMIFEKVTIKGKVKMLEKVAYGYYDLFAYNYQRGEVSENRYILQLPDQVIKVEPKNFREVMERYLFDCPEIRQKIVARQLNFEDTVNIFRIYNRWKQNQI
ncbi:MAG: hypothetical protein V4616_14290 [Bacteroidota bacterium]